MASDDLPRGLIARAMQQKGVPITNASEAIKKAKISQQQEGRNPVRAEQENANPRGISASSGVPIHGSEASLESTLQSQVATLRRLAAEWEGKATEAIRNRDRYARELRFAESFLKEVLSDRDTSEATQPPSADLQREVQDQQGGSSGVGEPIRTGLIGGLPEGEDSTS